MNAFQSAALIAVAHLSKLITGIVLIKIISLYLGPEGIGKLGHLISLITILYVFSGGGIQNGIVKYVSEFKTKPRELYLFLIEASQYSFIISFIISIILIIFSSKISFFLFGNEELYWVVFWLSVLQIFMSASKIILGVSNGLKNTFIFSSSSVLGNFLSIPIVWLLVKNYDFTGAVIAVSVSYFLTFIVLIYHLNKSIFINRLSKNLFTFRKKGRLYKYSLMTLISTLSIPLVEIFIRQMIIENNGLHDAGIWQATNKLSAAYMGFFSLYLAYYMMPSLSPCKTKRILLTTLIKNTLLISLLFLLFSTLFYGFKETIIEILLSKDFLPINPFIHCILIGDFFKIISFAIAFLYISKSITWAYILMEVIQGASLFIMTHFNFTTTKSLSSIFEAYAYSNAFSLLFSGGLLYYISRKNILEAHP